MAAAEKIIRLLLEHYPDPKLELEFRTPLQLLVAVMLSAQCPDSRVNALTPELFRKYRSAAAFAHADRGDLEQAIRPTGYYRNKARNIIACCRQLVADHGGRVPKDTDALTRLPGVGRKTANMVLGNAFGRPAIAVDTHVLRVSGRLGLATAKTARSVERELAERVPEEQWTAVSNALILHGRQVCTARDPRCCDCALHTACAWARKPEC